MEIASIGFRAKTGRAVAIALRHGDPSPAYLARWEVALHDPKIPATSQPHHEVMELPWSDAQVAVRQLEFGIENIATRVVATLMAEIQSRGFSVSGVGVVGSPDRKLERIGNPHIRAHAAEGILFRRVLEVAAANHNLQYRSFSDRGFEELTFPQLHSKPQEIKNTLGLIGRAAGKPWRADERVAAVAAWLMLQPVLRFEVGTGRAL
ncbi:MAG TPA: hypothetical protein VER98_18845 [Terriglobia bacterium]|nr:hypothetical protein [Terriglobia bacterium]